MPGPVRVELQRAREGAARRAPSCAAPIGQRSASDELRERVAGVRLDERAQPRASAGARRGPRALDALHALVECDARARVGQAGLVERRRRPPTARV